MSLSHHHHNQLHLIETGLLRSGPQLAARLSVFGKALRRAGHARLGACALQAGPHPAGGCLHRGDGQRHARAAPAAQLDGLELLSPATVIYRDVSVQELAVTAVPGRHPQLALVDELAHASLPGHGTRHTGRMPASCWTAASMSTPPSTSSISSRWARWSSGSPACTRPNPRPTRSCERARSRWSTLRPRRCAAAWPRGSSSPNILRHLPAEYAICTPRTRCRLQPQHIRRHEFPWRAEYDDLFPRP